MVTVPVFALTNFVFQCGGLPDTPASVVMCNGDYVFNRPGWTGQHDTLQYVKGPINLFDHLGFILQSFGPLSIPRL